MKMVGTFLVVFIGSAAMAQEIPKQMDVLRAMRLANGYFTAEWPDPGKAIVEWPGVISHGQEQSEPSHVWNRAVYYEGLMALYSIDPDKKYYDYAVEWGVKHEWTPVGGVSDRLADDQCAGQTWIDLHGIDAQPERIRNIKESMSGIISAVGSMTSRCMIGNGIWILRIGDQGGPGPLGWAGGNQGNYHHFGLNYRNQC